MSDDTQPPAAPENNAAPVPPWAKQTDPAPQSPGAPAAAPHQTPYDSPPDRDVWAPPADDAMGPGHTIASGSMPVVNPSVHDQQTITSLPSMGGTPAPAPWDSPSPQASGAFPPPSAPTPPNPFAPPAGPFVPPAAGEPVPPPPISPDGPGQPAYAYPGAGSGYGYPPAPAQPSAGYYGWPGVPPMPSNGMGTAALVLGIISDVLFLLWPIAILLGILAVIFGAVGRGKANHGEATNAGQALAGLICGVVGIVLGVGFGVLVLSEA